MSKYIAKKFEYIYLIGIDRYLMGFALASGRALRLDPRIRQVPRWNKFHGWPPTERVRLYPIDYQKTCHWFFENGISANQVGVPYK